jgi:hypothetical protein
VSVLLSYSLNDQTFNVILDASIDEQHSAQATITDHPVETGPSVTDHIRPLPRKLVLRGMTTNTPIFDKQQIPQQLSGIPGGLGGTTVADFSGNYSKEFTDELGRKYKALGFDDEKLDRVKAVYGALVEAALGGGIFTVVTSLATYENMAIEDFSTPRNVINSNSIEYQISFKELRIVTTELVDATAPKTKKKKRGNVVTKDPTPKQEKQAQTVAKDIGDALKNLGKVIQGFGG